MSSRKQGLTSLHAGLFVGLAVLGAAGPTLAAGGHYPPSAVFARDAVAYGRTYSEWSAAWYQWVSTQPASANPLFDTAPCSAGQSGPVWFLGGRYCSTENAECPTLPSERTCTVPAGKALYFPVVNFQCADAEARLGFCGPAGPVVNEMRAFIGDGIDQTINLRAEVDGRAIRGDLKTDFRVQSPFFTSFLPEDNFLAAIGEAGIGAGQVWVVDDGIYVMLKPLPRGPHTLRFTGTFPQYNFTLDFTYYLTVK